MDRRRLDTAGVIASGILGMPVPKTAIPQYREDVDYDVETPISATEIVEAMDAGKVVVCSEYYGIPNVWREAEGVYRGTLLQYRSVTEDPTFTDPTEAAAWFIATAYNVAG